MDQRNWNEGPDRWGCKMGHNFHNWKLNKQTQMESRGCKKCGFREKREVDVLESVNGLS